ncbi:MAG: hypothetical protein GF317_05985 [Candidatus Lokiarchaeota archaeon]|nr:hypothetical protein [Candidatus Lokiarchaeota archaeon]
MSKQSQKESEISLGFFILLVFLESIFTSYIVLLEINLLYTISFFVLIMFYTYIMMRWEREPLRFIPDRDQDPFKTIFIGITPLSKYEYVLIFALLLDLLLSFIYYFYLILDIVGFEYVAVIYLLLTGFLAESLAIRKVKKQEFWLTIIFVESISTRIIIIIVFLIIGYNFIWLYIIFILYAIISIAIFFDLDYAHFRAFVPDAYYILLVYHLSDFSPFSFYSFLVFSSILVPFVINLTNHVFQI